MPKYVVKKVDQLSANETSAIKQINDNLKAIADSFEDTVSRSGKVPSAMQAPLDMSGQRIINLPAPVDDGDAVRYKDLKEIPSLTDAARQFRNEAEAAASRAANSAALSEAVGKEYAELAEGQVDLAKAWAIADDFDERLEGESSSKAYSNLAMAIANAPEDVPVSMSDMQSRVIIKGDKGEQGIQGERGYYFLPTVSVEGNISWSNSGGLPNPATVNIKGPRGEQGVKGDKGDKGDRSVVAKAPVTITTDSWQNNEATLQMPDVKEDSILWVGPAPDSYDAYRASVIRATAQGEGTLTFACKSVPQVDINVEVIIG